MDALLSTIGCGVAVNYISDELLQGLSRIKDKQELHLFEKDLKEWAIDFEKTHDGTIATSGEFAGYVKNHRIVESVISYVLFPDMDGPDEQSFLKRTQADIVQALEDRLSHSLSIPDKEIIFEFLSSLLAQTKRFMSGRMHGQEKAILYILCQDHAWINRMEPFIQEQFHITHELLSQILDAMQTGEPLPEDETQLPPEFDQLILSCNDTLRKSQEKLKVYSFWDELDFNSVYVPPFLRKNIYSKGYFRFTIENMSEDDFILCSDPEWIPGIPSSCISYADNMKLKNAIHSLDERWQKINTLFDHSNIVYVIGGAGYGKSLFLKNLCVNPQGLTGYQEEPLLIIRGDLKRMIRDNGMVESMYQYLEECFVHTNIQKPDEIAPNFLKRCLKAGRCLILLDALDEVGNDQRNPLHQKVISYFQKTGPSNKICITSRDRGFIPEKQIACFAICPITIQNVGEYVDKFIKLGKFPWDEREQFMEQASSLVEKDFVSGFLTLSLLIAIYKNEQELPANKAELYKTCFEYIANRREKEKKLLRNSDTGEEYDWTILGKLMSEATFMRLACMGTPNNRDIRREQINQMMLDLYENRFSSQAECQDATELFLQFCADRTEVFVPSPSSNSEYRFFHRSFYEYFYANDLMRHSAGPEDIYQKLTAFQVDSELFELLVALYYQKDPEQLRPLLQYAFEQAKAVLQRPVSGGKAFDILVMLMQAADESDFTRQFIEFFMENSDKIAMLPFTASLKLVKEILSKNTAYLEEIYQKRKKIYEKWITRDVALFLLKNEKNYNQLLPHRSSFDISTWRLIYSHFQYTFLLELLPDQYSLMAQIFDRLKSSKFIYGILKIHGKNFDAHGGLKTRDNSCDALLTFAGKIRKCSVKEQEKAYALLLSMLASTL